MVAIVVPDFEVMAKWIQDHEEVKVNASSEEEICASPEINKLILDSMNQLATANKFNGLERVKKLYLHAEPFTE